ncbi:MerC domain-containing protein [Aurantiacibacter gangjinensis]|uniref:MerC mercury resistance protein n=1 Tax=Aurantiacibacter gangjinensis TaxID=502682 RepID=A0A0G9MS46_9SPHN|nr:MerC domain-containing protein [Aurantiacibacter gangjinensis]KLE33557.1 hypothetical protein AAW01_06620 [Aurantiacibacter gangjinensis]
MTLRRQANWLDGIGITISSICIVHCLLPPVIIALSPAWSTWLDLPEDLHPLLVAIALPFSGTVLWKAAKRSPHAQLSLGLGMVGLASMVFGLFAKSDAIEVATTSVGAILVAMAHLRNWLRGAHCAASGSDFRPP